MCAGGIPIANTTNPVDVVNAALDIQKFMLEFAEAKRRDGLPYFEVRLGVHTGPVVAGIIGERKFAYDIWGDAVNIASRMESSGEPGKVNISGTTYELVKDSFDCTHRGKVEAKYKGAVDMYFVNGRVH
jgi:class 3 adenylate cyclase